MLVDENADDEDIDDPIQLLVDDKIDIRWYSDEVVVIDDDSDDTESNKNNSKISVCQVQFDEYIYNFPKRTSILPQSFSCIEKNIEQLNRCRPLKIQIVDCYKFPWYYKNTVNISPEENKEDDIVIIDNISDIRTDYNVISFYDENCNFINNNKLFENNPVRGNYSHDYHQRKRSLSYSNGKKELIDFTKYNKQKLDTEAKTNLKLIDNETFDLYLNIGSLIEKDFREIKYPENGLLKSNNNYHLNNKKNIDSDTNILEINSHKIISIDRKDIVNNQNLKFSTKRYCKEDNIINKKNIIEQSEHKLKSSYLDKNKESSSKASDVNIKGKKGIKCLKRNTALTNDSESLQNRNICQNYKSCLQCEKQLHNANNIIPHFHSKSSIDTKAISKNKCPHKIASTVSVNHRETTNNQDNINETGQVINRLKNVTNYQQLFNGFCGQDNDLPEYLDKNKKCTINSETVLDHSFVLKSPFSTFMNSSLPQVYDYPITQLFTKNVVNNSMTQNTLMNTRDSISSEPNSECDNLVAPFAVNQELYSPTNLSKNKFASSSSNSDIVSAINYKSNRNLQVNSLGCNKVPHTQVNSKNKQPIMKNILNSPAAYSSNSKGSPVPNSHNFPLNTRNNLDTCITQTVQDTYRAPYTPSMPRFPFWPHNIRQPLRSINSNDIQRSIPKRPLYHARYGGQPGCQPGGMPTYNYRPTHINAHGKFSTPYKPYSMPSATNEKCTKSAYTNTNTNKSVPEGCTFLVYPASLSRHSSKDNPFDNVAENTYQNINYGHNLQFMKEVHANLNASAPLSTHGEPIRRYEIPNTCIVTCKESLVNATAPLLNNQPCLVSNNQTTTNQVSQSRTCSVTSTMFGQSDEVQLNISQVTIETLTSPTLDKHNVTLPCQVIDNTALICSQSRQSSVSIATTIPSQGLRFINQTSAPYSPSRNQLQKVTPPKMAVTACSPKTTTSVSISQNVNRLKVNKSQICLLASARQSDDSCTSASVSLNGDHAQSLKTVTLVTRGKVSQGHRSSNLTRDPRISKYGLQQCHALNIPVNSCGQEALKSNVNSSEALTLSSPPIKIAECLKSATVFGQTQINPVVTLNDPTFSKISQPLALKNSTPNNHKLTHLQSQLHSYNALTFTSTNESLQNTFLCKHGESQKQCMSNLTALTQVSNDTSLNEQVLCKKKLPNVSTDVAKSPTSVPTVRQLKKVSMSTFMNDPKATNDSFSDRNKLTFDDMSSSSQIVKYDSKTVALVAKCETPAKKLTPIKTVKELNFALFTFAEPSKDSTASKIQKPTQSLPLVVACQLANETKPNALAPSSGKTQKSSVSLDLKTNNESKFTMPISQVSKDLAGQCTSQSSETQKSTLTSSSDSIGFYSPPILPISSYEKTLEVFEQLNSSYLDYDRLNIIHHQDNCSEGNKVKRKSFNTCEKSAKRISLQEYEKRQ